MLHLPDRPKNPVGNRGICATKQLSTVVPSATSPNAPSEPLRFFFGQKQTSFDLSGLMSSRDHSW